MKKYIVFDISKCCACSACAMACIDQNDIDIAAGEKPYRRALEYELREGSAGECEYLSLSCMHCQDAPCVMGCPTGCLTKDLETGMTVYNRDRCIGCHSCSLACPFGVPSFGADGKIRECDGCHVRVSCGIEPACVRACAFGALQCLDEAAYEQMQREKGIRFVVKALVG